MEVWTQSFLTPNREVITTVVVDGKEIGAVAAFTEGEWENVFWAAELGHSSFATKQQAIDDLVQWYKESIS